MASLVRFQVRESPSSLLFWITHMTETPDITATAWNGEIYTGRIVFSAAA
jgi:hypothetical protein